MSQWFVYKCSKCGRWQVKENRKKILKTTFKCMSCNKNSKIITGRHSRHSLKSYGPFEASAMATAVCKRIKLHEQTKSDKIWNIDLEFSTPSTNTY